VTFFWAHFPLIYIPKNVIPIRHNLKHSKRRDFCNFWNTKFVDIFMMRNYQPLYNILSNETSKWLSQLVCWIIGWL